MGLVTRLVPVADLDATVDEMAERLAAGPARALSLTKQLLDASADGESGVCIEVGSTGSGQQHHGWRCG